MESDIARIVQKIGMDFKPSPIPSVVGFYGKMDLTKFGILYKNRTPGSVVVVE